MPLDETLAQVTVDLSGRPYLVYNVNLPDRKIKTFDLGLFEDFFQAFVTHGGLNLHINLQYGPVEGLAAGENRGQIDRTTFCRVRRSFHG